MKIIGIEHVGIAVDDLEGTSSFWGDILRIANTHTEKVESEGVNIIGYTAKGGINYNMSPKSNVYLNLGTFSRPPFFNFVFLNLFLKAFNLFKL